MLRGIEANLLGFRFAARHERNETSDTSTVARIIDQFMPQAPKKRAGQAARRQPDVTIVATSSQTPTVADVQLTLLDDAAQARPGEVREMIELLSLSTSLSPPAPDAWRETIGMFDDDPYMQEIFTEVIRINEASRPD